MAVKDKIYKVHEQLILAPANNPGNADASYKVGPFPRLDGYWYERDSTGKETIINMGPWSEWGNADGVVVSGNKILKKETIVLPDSANSTPAPVNGDSFFVTNVGNTTWGAWETGGGAWQTEGAGPTLLSGSLPVNLTGGILLQYELATDTWHFVIPSTGSSTVADHFLGEYATLVALQTAHPAPSTGSYAFVDAGVGTDAIQYIWDTTDNKYVALTGGGGGGTDDQIAAEVPVTAVPTNYSATSQNVEEHLKGIDTELATIPTVTNSDDVTEGVANLYYTEARVSANTNVAANTAKLAGIEAGATGDMTGAEIKAAYEAETNTNAFTDAEQTKLAGIDAGATDDQTGAEIKAALFAETDTNNFDDASLAKLTAIEAGATGDQTGAEIKALYEAETNTNAFTDAEQTKLAGIEANATGDQTGAEIKALYEAETDTNAFTDSEKSKLAAIDAAHYLPPVQGTADLTAIPEASLTDKARVYVEDATSDYFYDATAVTGDFAPDDQTGGTGFWKQVAVGGETAASIKAKYESNGDTNVFLDAEKAKLAAIEAGATGDQTGPEISALLFAETDTNNFNDTLLAKLTAIEAGATGDQTAAEIKAAYESNGNTNEFDDAEKAKLATVETNAAADQNANEVPVTLVATNYTAGSADVEAHLTGINTALDRSQIVGTTTVIDLTDPGRDKAFNTFAAPSAATAYTLAAGDVDGGMHNFAINAASKPSMPAGFVNRGGTAFAANTDMLMVCEKRNGELLYWFIDMQVQP